MAKRGRPRKNPLPEETKMEEVKDEVTPQMEHKLKVLKEDKVVRDNLKVVDTWYENNNGKLIKCMKKSNGNLYRMYWGSTAKEQDLIEEMKKKGKYRAK